MMSLLSDVPSYSQASSNRSAEAQAFIIETDEAAAGVIVRQNDGYRFFASEPQFQPLDGSVFKNPKAAQKAAELMSRAAARDHADRRRFARNAVWS